MNGRYLREMPTAELAQKIEQLTGRHDTEPAVAIAQEKMQTLTEFDRLCAFLYEEPAGYDEKAWRKTMKEGAPQRLELAREALANVEPWTQDNVQQALDAVVQQTGDKPGQVFQPIRVAITGTTVSPGIYESVHLLGRERTLERIDRALAHAREAASAAPPAE